MFQFEVIAIVLLILFSLFYVLSGVLPNLASASLLQEILHSYK